MQTGVQEGAGARRRHQSVGEETILSSVLEIKDLTQHRGWCEEFVEFLVTKSWFENMVANANKRFSFDLEI